MERSLAIIIPAYKSRFLGQALESAARQTCKDFTLYIGDDNSPEDLYTIVRGYQDRINIVYQKFGTNLGGKDLPAHWERCIEMAKEPYIYLFSDDDIMPCDIVERFLMTLEQYPGHDFFRMQLAVIDQDNNITRCNPPLHEDNTDARTLLLDKLSCRTTSAACEYIFSAKLFKSTGGFVHFPHAWCTDDATWFRMAKAAGGAVSIKGYPALWRNVSNCNISDSSRYDMDKEKATAMFIEWLAQNYPELLKDKEFISGLYIYVRCILDISLAGRCSREGFEGICNALRKFSRRAASKVRFRSIIHRQHTRQ